MSLQHWESYVSVSVWQLEEAAKKRWGSLEELEAEKNKRVEKKEKRALEKAKDADKGICLFRLRLHGGLCKNVKLYRIPDKV